MNLQKMSDRSLIELSRISTLEAKKKARKVLEQKPGETVAAAEFANAYRIIFHTDLKERLKELVAEYGETPSEGLAWELWMYGHSNPNDLLQSLG